MPPLDAVLESVLACPLCKGPLELREEEVRCPRCQRAWPVEDGIPRLIAERMSVTRPR